MSKSHFLVKLRKFESAPTVMYCILSSVIQENTQELSVTILHPLLVGYLVAVIYKVGTAKVKERGGGSCVNRKAACMNSRRKFFKC